MSRTKAISVHKTRRKAREKEQRLQAGLDILWDGRMSDGVRAKTLEDYGLPLWTKGVRVEKIGWFQFAVVATEHKGH